MNPLRIVTSAVTNEFRPFYICLFNFNSFCNQLALFTLKTYNTAPGNATNPMVNICKTKNLIIYKLRRRKITKTKIVKSKL